MPRERTNKLPDRGGGQDGFGREGTRGRGQDHFGGGRDGPTPPKMRAGSEPPPRRQQNGGRDPSPGMPSRHDSYQMPPSALAGKRPPKRPGSRAGFSSGGGSHKSGSKRSDTSEEQSLDGKRPGIGMRRRSISSDIDRGVDGSKQERSSVESLSQVFGVTYTRFEPHEDLSPWMRRLYGFASVVCFLPLLIKYYFSSIARISHFCDTLGTYVLICARMHTAPFRPLSHPTTLFIISVFDSRTPRRAPSIPGGLPQRGARLFWVHRRRLVWL